MDIKKRVSSLVRMYQSRDPFEIVKGLNTIIVFAPLINVRGFYQYFQRNNIIYIDENLSYHEQKYVCAHELGHMFLHKKSNAIYMDTKTFLNSSKYEIEADTFAVNLLISDLELQEFKDYTLKQIARIYGYSERLIELRLKNFYA